jgi:Leucine-rich repeat (LRR) protein
MPMPKMNWEEQEAYDEALRRIREYRSTERVLHLGELGLTRLPPEIGQLSELNSLQLYNNKLTTLPPEIGNLTALSDLNLFKNRFTELPTEIGQLTALTSCSFPRID